MGGITDMKQAEIAEQAARELLDDILPYWLALQDPQRGGCYGGVTGAGLLQRDAPRGLVVHSRILWTFSAAHRLFPNASYLQAADRAFDYLCNRFQDGVSGGYFWILDSQGQPADTRKQVYGHAFALYGLAEYHRASGNPKALELAKQLFALLEGRCRDQRMGGYFEAFVRDFSAPLAEKMLADDLSASKTMNTHLHLLEAYTGLYRVWPDGQVAQALQALIDLFLQRILGPDSSHLRLFFDADWTALDGRISFGHDVECGWLLEEAAQTLGRRQAECRRAARLLSRSLLDEGMDPDGGVRYERLPGAWEDTDRCWWVQAESAVGLLNAWQQDRDEAFGAGFERAWRYILEHFVDKSGGEWYRRVDAQGRPKEDLMKVDLWKCPYHNARACMEIHERLATPA